MGVVGARGELLNPFGHIDAAIWSESDVPQYMIETAYEYCEELTRVEAGNFYHSFKYLPNEDGKPSARTMHSVEGQTISQMETMSIHTLEALPTIQSL